MDFKSNLDLLQAEPLLKLLKKYRSLSWVKLYLSVVTFTYIIPAVVAIVTNRAFKNPNLDDSFFYDLAVFWEGAVCAPLILIFLRKTFSELPVMLHKLCKENRICLPENRIKSITEKYNKIGNLRWIYLLCFLATIPCNISWIVPFLRDKTLTYLVTIDAQGIGHISFIGLINIILIVTPFLYLIFLALYKIIIMTLLFFDINNVRKNDNKPTIIIEPINPGGAGGLGSIGRISMLLSTPFFAIGAVIMAIIIREVHIMKEPGYTRYVVMLIGYFLSAIIVFILPLYPFHNQMVSRKKQELSLLGKEFQKLYRKYQKSLGANKDGVNEESILDRLEKIATLYNLTKRMPIWPFNGVTLGRFLGIIISPITILLPAITGPLLGKLFS